MEIPEVALGTDVARSHMTRFLVRWSRCAKTRERRITAAEAFILQLTRKGLAGDSAAARASLAAIENARATRVRQGVDYEVIRIHFRTFGLCCVVEDLGIGVTVHPTDKDRVRLMLKPWIIEAALARLGTRRLSAEEQQTVLASVKAPEKVNWPEWWVVRAKSRLR